jgi:hypothetical protein
MSDRETLIAQKQALRRQIERMQRDLEQARAAMPPDRRRVRLLENRLDALMAEEYSLRLAIDRSPRLP